MNEILDQLEDGDQDMEGVTDIFILPPGSLKQHQQDSHEGKQYPCGVCTYQSTSEGDLRLHQEAVHKGKKYPCGACGYQSTTKGNLKLFMKERSILMVHVLTNVLLKVTSEDTKRMSMK